MRIRPIKCTATQSISRLEEWGLCRLHKLRTEVSTAIWVLSHKEICLSRPSRREWCLHQQTAIAKLTANKKLLNINCICRGSWTPSSRGLTEKLDTLLMSKFSSSRQEPETLTNIQMISELRARTKESTEWICKNYKILWLAQSKKANLKDL